jgi:uncharacterized membrane protein (UPF0127 family)
MRHALKTAWFTFAVLAAAACAQTPAQKQFQPAQLRDFPRSTLAVERREGRDTFRIWIADTDARQQQGLMWIQQLPADYAMLFPLDPPREMSMWMKNTYVPLDMLFFDSSGRITHIRHHANPLSEEIIWSNGEVAGVVEIRGDEAKRRGIAVGDRIVVGGPGS